MNRSAGFQVNGWRQLYVLLVSFDSVAASHVMGDIPLTVLLWVCAAFWLVLWEPRILRKSCEYPSQIDHVLAINGVALAEFCSRSAARSLVADWILLLAAVLVVWRLVQLMQQVRGSAYETDRECGDS